ncbi:MAG: PorT family protein [Dysgonamonadaceae bacterium]|nr:PorT family protein [Dysgonamonadaceae bacterium]
MRKIVLTFVVLLSLGFTQVNAQVSFGIKANANMSNFLLSDMGKTESSMKVGASLGGIMKMEISKHFALQPELMFHYKSSEMKTSKSAKTDFEYWGMEIPIYAVVQTQVGNGKSFIGVGPYVGFGFSAKYKAGDIDLYKKDKVTDKAVMDRFDFGLGAMLGYEFNSGIFINGSYQFGLVDNLDANKKNATMRPQTVSFGIGCRF